MVLKIRSILNFENQLNLVVLRKEIIKLCQLKQKSGDEGVPRKVIIFSDSTTWRPKDFLDLCLQMVRKCWKMEDEHNS